MSSGNSGAEKKFWKMPEMVEMLLPFLDLESTSILAHCHELTRHVLQGSFVWNRLVKNSRLSDGAVFFWFLDNGLFQEMVRQVKHFVAILKLLEDPKDNLENLLDAICHWATWDL